MDAPVKAMIQLRFDVIIRSAGLEVVAPIRELNLTRDWEIEYARAP